MGPKKNTSKMTVFQTTRAPVGMGRLYNKYRAITANIYCAAKRGAKIAHTDTANTTVPR